MAAPSGIEWGSVYGSGDYQGRIGVYCGVSNTNTKTTVTVEVWFWSRYSCTDSKNTLYYDHGANVTAATTEAGSVTVKTTTKTSWSTSNQVKLLQKTYTYTRGTSQKVYKVYTKWADVDYVGKTMYAQAQYTVPALTSYTVSYSANGGSGAPSSQTKWYGKDLTLSGTKPTLTGHSFDNWLSSAQSQTFAPGDLYSYNASTTMTAQWKANTYTVDYNANGGSGAPQSQTKTYGVALTLSTTTPTRTNYNFLGWGTSAAATTVSYASGASYTENAAITLYAVWELAYSEPTITAVSVLRSDSAGVSDDYGTYACVSFSWSCDQTTGENVVSSIVIKHKVTTASSWTSMAVSASGTSGTVSKVIGGGALSVDNAYSVSISVTDSKGGTTTITRTLNGAKFPIDFLAGGNGVAVGKPASIENAFESDFDIYANKEVYDKYGQKMTNGQAEYIGSSDEYIDPNTTLAHVILTAHTNAPMGLGTWFYITTVFHADKTTSSYKAQWAVPYDQGGSMYHRYFHSNGWSDWRRHKNADEDESAFINHEAITDANEATAPGVYYLRANSSNSPDSSKGFVLASFKTSMSGVCAWFQIASNNSTSTNFYIRPFSGTSQAWGAWRKITTTAVS